MTHLPHLTCQGRPAMHRGLLVALTAFLLTAVPASAEAMKLHAKVARLGSSEASLTLTARTTRGSICSARVRAPRKQSLKLPVLVARHSRVAWRWAVPPGAPSGRWRFRSTCTRPGHSSRGRASARVSVLSLGARGGIALPGSIEATAGRYLNPPKPQMIAFDPSGSKGGGGNPGEPGYCTWGAWNDAQWLGSAVYGPPGANQNHARYWAANAARNGLPTGTQPRVGAVFVHEVGVYGHVGVVTQVLSPTTFMAHEMNGGGKWTNAALGKTNEFGVYANHQHTTDKMRFIYQPGTQPGAYVGHIVQWDGDTKTQKTAWLVGQDGKRRWIPTIAIYGCLKNKGIPGPDVLPAAKLNEYPDLVGTWVWCDPNGSFGASSDTPPSDPNTTMPPSSTTPVTTPPPPQTSPPPPPPSWNETVGGNANTWTNYTNAGGTQGPTIPARTTVQISCKVTGFRVQDGNTWWYRIHSSPWNDQFYVSADAFYNNGQTSGSLIGTPFVDPAVANC